MRINHKVLALLLCILPAVGSASEPAQVLLLGTFHFRDAGLDTVKVEDINVFEASSQAFLESFAQAVAAFAPTHVLLEYNPENEAGINDEFQQYLAGKLELPANEIYQLGFRIARLSGLAGVTSFDHREIGWAATPMLDYAKQHDPAAMAAFEQVIDDITRDEKQARATMSLQQLLLRQNDPEMERLNMALYVKTNGVGAGDGYAGADAAASWWHRNFRMYANIQRLAKPGARVVAIGGSGHMAIIRQLLALDSDRVAVSPIPYLKGVAHSNR